MRCLGGRALGGLAVALVAAIATAPAHAAEDPAAQWLPSPEGASWVYEWSNSAHAPKRTRERYTVAAHDGRLFRLAWTTEGQGNGDGTVPSRGAVDYRRTDAGLVNLNWTSTAPPPQFPVLCANATDCANSLAGTHYLAIWGNRSPVLVEPLLRGTRWNAVGGAENDVSSANRYLGVERVRVAAFPHAVPAARVESDLTQAGALGDPFGSGIRTTWWVYGVGPVKVRFQHAGGELSEAELVATDLAPRPAPADVNYLPFSRGETMRFRWRNDRHLRRPSVQRLTVKEVVNNTARVDVQSLSGPLKVAGSYVFSTRLNGVRNLAAATRSAARVRLPRLGPLSQPADRRRRLVTPMDFMAFGFNPVLPAHPAVGMAWQSSKGSRDYRVFGVTGRTRILGVSTIRTPAGRVRALAVRSTLQQRGFPFGSGTRTSWFAPGRGLVKLVFRHRDGSVSTVERLR